MNQSQQSRESLRRRIVGAGAWVFGGHVAGQALRLAGNLLMTRLLVPEMFGVMAVANVLIMGLALFSDFGLRQNIIQSRRGNDRAFLNTAWVLQIIRGCLIWLVALLAAFALNYLSGRGWIAEGSVYDEPVLSDVIVALSFMVLISGFNSTSLVTSNRDLALGKITILEITSQVVAIVVMVFWAISERSIWALVAGALVGASVKMILSHRILPGEGNRLQWDDQAFNEIFHFGKWIFLTSILGFFASSLDRILLGALIDSKMLGLYSIAFLLVSAFLQTLQKIFGNVAFPAFSEVVRERPHDLVNVYYKFRLPVDVFALLLFGILFSSGDLLVSILYDERYLPAGNMLEVLSISVFAIRFSLAGQCFLALGKPKLLMLLLAIKVGFLILSIPAVFDIWGFDGVLWVIGFSYLVNLPFLFYFQTKYFKIDINRELIVLPLVIIGYGIGFAAEQILKAANWIL